ncbi:MAG: methylmalonyl Co-A mutase-associated GTPase MeaB [Myxococcota bacterium]
MSVPATPPRRRQLSVQDHVHGVLEHDRAVLARTITLIESNHPDHRHKAQQVLVELLPHTGHAHRVGITGVPGVGKSTLIERLGLHLLEQGHRLAVLAIDPTSALRGGSILGDKTRMSRLSMDHRAFIRPSPTQGSLGGVHRKTRETMLVCEAAGFDVVMVETVGVGQSEIKVADMVDTYVVLMLAGAGDELQGIKKGILEVADLIAVNKADGDNMTAARRARRDYTNALRFIHARSPHWSPPVLTCSGLNGHNLDRLWDTVQQHRTTLEQSGEFEARRRQQRLQWMWALVEHELMMRFKQHPHVQRQLSELQHGVLNDHITPTLAAERLLGAFGWTD